MPSIRRPGRRRTDRIRTEGAAGPPAAPRPAERRLRLRTLLLILLLVPSVALLGLCTADALQLTHQVDRERADQRMSDRMGQPAFALFAALEVERRFTAEALGSPGAPRTALLRQRAATDQAAAAFRRLTSVDTAGAQAGLAESVAGTVRRLGGLAAERHEVDTGIASGDEAFTYYSGVIDSSLRTLVALGRTTDGNVASRAQTLDDLLGAMDTIGREDALLSGGWSRGYLTAADYEAVVESIGAQRYLLVSRIAPDLTDDETRQYQRMAGSAAWGTKTQLEDWLTSGAPGLVDGRVVLRPVQAQWRAAVDQVLPQLGRLLLARVNTVLAVGQADARQSLDRITDLDALTVVAVLLVIAITWRLTALLRRRIRTLQEQAQQLYDRLPDVVARLERGEQVDVDSEVSEIRPTSDELGELGHLLNLAGRSAVATAVRQAEQHRGFERLLQRIARRTQLLIGLQLRKLDELERRHEDPAVLEGLFDLDHLTARLRRYEENLVILGGGQPQRRWRKPVRLLDVLRAAQGEVQDYRRISIEVESTVWVAERAVGPLTHILAELMENAAAFSKPPTPVEVKAGPVGRGITVEIEDRGLGMSPEEYAAANALMLDPPELDVLTRADDARLGLYVVARLAAGLGLQVELRPSVFGGTRVIVLVPDTLVAAPPRPTAVPDPAVPESTAPAVPEPAPEPAAPDAPRPVEPALGRTRQDLPIRARGSAMAGVAAGGSAAARAAGPGTADETAGSGPAKGTAGIGSAGVAGDVTVGAGSADVTADTDTADVTAAAGSAGVTVGVTADVSAAGGSAATATADGPVGGIADPTAGAARAAASALSTSARPERPSPAPDGEPDSASPGGQPGASGARPNGAGRTPLPQRTRQAALAPELRLPATPDEHRADAGPETHARPERSGAAVAAFQRQSRRHRPATESAGPTTVTASAAVGAAATARPSPADPTAPAIAPGRSGAAHGSAGRRPHEVTPPAETPHPYGDDRGPEGDRAPEGHRTVPDSGAPEDRTSEDAQAPERPTSEEGRARGHGRTGGDGRTRQAGPMPGGPGLRAGSPDRDDRTHQGRQEPANPPEHPQTRETEDHR